MEFFQKVDEKIKNTKKDKLVDGHFKVKPL